MLLLEVLALIIVSLSWMRISEVLLLPSILLLLLLDFLVTEQLLLLETVVLLTEVPLSWMWIAEVFLVPAATDENSNQ